MQIFWSMISSFPVAIPSILLIVVLIYWLAAMIGLVDVDHLHGHFDLGHSHMADVGHVGGHHGPEADSADLGHVASYVMALGLNGVPFSIVVSLITLFTWALTYLGQRYLLLWLPDLLRWLLGCVLLAAAFAASLPISALLLRPLRGMFIVHNALSNDHLVGQTCRILTLEVSDSFGRAEVSGHGAPYNIRVWARTPNVLRKGSIALVIAYDPARQQFEVSPLPE